MFRRFHPRPIRQNSDVVCWFEDADHRFQPPVCAAPRRERRPGLMARRFCRLRAQGTGILAGLVLFLWTRQNPRVAGITVRWYWGAACVVLCAAEKIQHAETILAIADLFGRDPHRGSPFRIWRKRRVTYLLRNIRRRQPCRASDKRPAWQSLRHHGIRRSG